MSTKTIIGTKTADESGAGTDSNIFVVLHGLKQNSPEFRLQDLGSGNLFERDDVDSFTLNHAEIGRLWAITIRSDGMYAGSDWRLSQVFVRSIGSNGKDEVKETISVNDWVDGESLDLVLPVPNVSIEGEEKSATKTIDGDAVISDNLGGKSELRQTLTFSNRVHYELSAQSGEQVDESTGLDFSYSAGAEAKGLKAGWQLGLSKKLQETVFSKVGIKLGEEKKFEAKYELTTPPGKRVSVIPKWTRTTREFDLRIGKLTRSVRLPESLAFAGVNVS